MNRQNYIQAILLFFLSLSTAYANSRNDVAAYSEAQTKFSVLVSEAEQNSKVEQLLTDEVDALVSVLSDDKRFLKPAQYTTKELGNLLDLCGMSNKAVMSLALFDLKRSINPKDDPQLIAGHVAAVMMKNAESFGRFLSRLQPFLIRCLSAQVAPMAEFVSALAPGEFTDVRRQGLHQFQNGIAQLFAGVILSLGNQNSEEAYRLALVQALTGSSPNLVSAMPVAMRLQIRSMIDSAQKTMQPIFRPYLETISRDLENTSCIGLCNT